MHRTFNIDSKGSAIGAARMNPAEAYGSIPQLLKEYINEGSDNTWQLIRKRIDNLYITVCAALDSLEQEVHYVDNVKNEVGKNKKLLFKPNQVVLPLIDYYTYGPGMTGVCTPWEFAAVVMRWFHDRAGIRCERSCISEDNESDS